jgi:PKD repeat protein
VEGIHRIVVLLLLAAASLHVRAGGGCIWYADDDSINQVDTATHRIVAKAPIRKVHRLVMNADDCGVWALDKHDRRLVRVASDGTIEYAIRLSRLDPRLDEAERLQVDPYDSSLWIADDRWLFHVSPAGDLLGKFPAPGDVRRLQLALDRTLWVLGKRELWRFDAEGRSLTRHALGSHLAGDARFFAVDSLGDVIWVVDENSVTRLQMSEPNAPPLRLRIRGEISAFALDPVLGTVWMTNREDLLAFTRQGELLHKIDLERMHVRGPHELAFDPVGRTLWLGSERSVTAFTASGTLLARFAARDANEAFGVPAFKVAPTLTLVRPPKDALTNNPQPEFRLGYGAECNGQPCDLGSAHLGAYELSATLNAAEIGNAFLFDPTAREAHHTPSARLPEGKNEFDARLKDGFGNHSQPISSVFTVDTTAPRFLTLSPAEGSIFQVPQAVIQGTVDDPAASVILNSLVQTGGAFSFPVVLAEGVNTFGLSALDKAGNSASVLLRLTYVPVSVTIESPASGAAISGDTVLVTGTFQGPSNTGITVNGAAAAMHANRFYANVSLQPGTNPVEVIATSPAGATASASVSVTSSGTAPVQLSASRSQGMAPMPVAFSLIGAPGISIARIDADFDGDGTIDATTISASTSLQHTYAAPGLYQARFTATDTQGTVHVAVQPIVVVSVASMDTMLRGVYSGAMASLRSRNVEGALRSFTASAAARYQEAFNALGPELPSVVDQLGTLQEGTISDGYAEYLLVRNTPDGPQGFLIYMIKGEDGVWRIDTM